jgi:hypothetical protein
MNLFSLPLLPYMSRDETKDEKTVNYIIEKTTAELENRHGLYKAGSGIAGINIIEELYIAFSIYKPLSKEQARELILDCSKVFINNINNNSAIQTQLIKHPFPIENIRITIVIHNSDGSSIFHPYICVVSLEDGEIVFNTKDRDVEFGYKTEEVETYEEDLKLSQY